MPKMMQGMDWVPTEMNGLTRSGRGYFAYNQWRAEYSVDVRHQAAPNLARIVLMGVADYDRLPDDVVGQRVGGLLMPLLAAGNTGTQVVGVSTTNPNRLYVGLDAYTRLPGLTISDRELAHLARADFKDLWGGMRGQLAADVA